MLIGVSGRVSDCPLGGGGVFGFAGGVWSIGVLEGPLACPVSDVVVVVPPIGPVRIVPAPLVVVVVGGGGVWVVAVAGGV